MERQLKRKQVDEENIPKDVDILLNPQAGGQAGGRYVGSAESNGSVACARGAAYAHACVCG